MKQRNKCPVCGKGIGQRKTHIEELKIRAGEAPVWPPTNEHVLQVVSNPFGDDGHGNKLLKLHRTLWDGESFYEGARAPFCGNPCALKLARAAHKAGFKL